MRAIAPFAIPTILLNATIVYFGISPTFIAIICSVILSFVLSYFLRDIYKRQSWIIPGIIGFAFPIIGFLFIGIWRKAAFSWDIDYNPPIYVTALLFIAWTMILSAPYMILFSLINGIRSFMRNTAEQDAAANP